ncbi:MAG: hypothetical protein JXX28_06030 [Deltaproteobacteria bacterium]|nr:hypothetical protein [Deltaproteobacteria bacterium]
MRAAIVLSFPLLLAACKGEEAPPVKTLEELAAEKCPKVHMDRMEGGWVLVTGNTKNRMEIVPKGASYMVYYSNENGHYELTAQRREKDLQLTEVPRLMRKELIAKGEAEAMRMYLRPYMESCSIKVQEGTVSATGRETIAPPSDTKEFLAMPAGAGVFSYRPADDWLFLGPAAKSRATAKAQLAKDGFPKPEVPGSHAIPVAAWSDAQADGPASCSYDADLFFDGKRVQEKVPAKGVTGGERYWYVDWDANWSFNHTFEMYRYRTCGGSERELIGVAGIDALLV